MDILWPSDRYFRAKTSGDVPASGGTALIGEEKGHAENAEHPKAGHGARCWRLPEFWAQMSRSGV
jgi:hypothetical protein